MSLRSHPNRALAVAAALRRISKPDPQDDRNPRIEGIAFSAATIRSGAMAVAKIRGQRLYDGDVRCEAMSTGFILDVLPQHAVQSEGEQLVLAMRVFRRLGTPSGLCLVRVSVGESSAVGSITVRV